MNAGKKILSAVVATAILASGLAVVFAQSKPAAPVAAGGANWASSYRGPKRDGISTEKFTVPASDKIRKLWKKDVGPGFSSASVADGLVYTMGGAGGKETVWCFKADNGDEVWKYEYNSEDKSGGHEGPRCTPTIDGKLVYVVSNDGQVFCLDPSKAGDAAVVWSKKASDLGGSCGDWGYACSPLISGDMVIVDVGPLVAMNKKNGEVVWTVGEGKAGYSSPVEFTSGGKQMVAAFPESGLRVFDLKGNKICQYAWNTEYGVNAACPVIVGDKIFISSGYDAGCAMVDLKGKELVKNKNMRNHANSCVYYNGCLFGFDGQVGGGSLKCISATDLSKKWDKRIGNGHLMLADGKLIIQNEHGDLIIAEASDKEYKELARVKQAVEGSKCWNMPVFVGGKIFCRSDSGDFACFDVSGK